MRIFFIDPSAAASPVATIKGPEAHHIKTVLRLKPGDDLTLFDGTGHEYEAVITALGTDSVDVKIKHGKQPQPANGDGVRITVAQAFLKEKKMDDLVRKLSELGIAGWIPFFSQRSIPRPDAKRLAGRTQRWRRIATEALKQCRRKDLLNISEAHTFAEVLQISNSCDLKVVFWENDTVPFDRAIGTKTAKPYKSIMVMLGPEGGFTAREIEMARQSGFVTAGLGPRILRAETATLAAATIVQYLFGDMGPQAGKSDEKVC